MRISELPSRNIVLDAGGCHTPITIIEPPPGVNPAGSAIVFHGLSANRRVMTYLGSDFAGHGLRTYLLDLPGHGDNTDEFSFARAEQCATAVVESLAKTDTINPKKTILVGHSMGGAIAIRMADRDPVAATIAISPAPMVMPRRMPANLFVISAQHDFDPLRKQAQELAEAAGGNRVTSEDFVQRRAFELRHFAHATHTSLLTDRTVAHDSELWAMQALFPQIPVDTLNLNLDLATYDTFRSGRRRLAGGLMGMIGIMLLFPLCAALAGILAGRSLPEVPTRISQPSLALAVTEGAACAVASVLILAVFIPLTFLHIYAGDYLASLLLIAGSLLLALNWKAAKEYWTPGARAFFAAAVLGFVTMLAIGAWLNWQLDDAWLNAPRWLRFAALLPVAWVFCFAEEVMLGPLRRGWGRALRFGIFLALRLELWLACLLAYYVLGSGQALLVILVISLALVSLLQRLAIDSLLRRTGSPAAASLFGAILVCWFIAAVFPLT